MKKVILLIAAFSFISLTATMAQTADQSATVATPAAASVTTDKATPPGDAVTGVSADGVTVAPTDAATAAPANATRSNCKAGTSKACCKSGTSAKACAGSKESTSAHPCTHGNADAAAATPPADGTVAPKK